MTYLIAVALILLVVSVDRSDAGCCGCCGCCPCCCCKPIVIKLPPPPTKICPCCCCCKPCCCCCCCKPCCCCCCPCCCCGGGGGGRRKRDIVNIAAKKFSDILLPQQDAFNGLMPQQLACNCQRAVGNGCGGSAMPPQRQFTPQFQQPSPLCGSTGGCGGFSGGMGGGCGSGFPPLHQLPIIHGGNGGGLNSFHAGNAGFGSNMMNGCGGGGMPCSDCPNGGGGCGLGCGGGSGGGGGAGGCHDCMLLGDCSQCGGGPNGCLRRLRRRRRRSVFGAVDASRQRQYHPIDGSGGAEQLNDSAADKHPTAAPANRASPSVASKKRKSSNGFVALKKKPQKQHRRRHEHAKTKTVTLRRQNKRKVNEVTEAYV